MSVQVIECFSPRRLRSTNEFSERDWRGRYRERKDWEWELRALLGRPRLVAGPVLVRVTRYLGPRERRFDPGNLEGGSVKQILDALVRLGWLRDDSPRWLELVIAQDGTRRLKPGTAIRIEVREEEK